METKIVDQSYIKATIYTTTQGAEALAALLPVAGVDSYSVEDPLDLDFIIASKDKLAWDFVGLPPASEEKNGEVRLAFWLERNENAEEILQNARMMLLKLKSDEQYGLFGEDADFGRLWLDTEAEHDDWKYQYKETFRTFSPVDGFLIVPPWEVAETPEVTEMICIVIDPGMAFGTGSHETTSMCLAGLKQFTHPGDLALDAGTGSGILAIAAAKLGAHHVYAVEVDADAADSAAGNIAANNANEKISLIVGDIMKPETLPQDIRFNVITANLSCVILLLLLPALKRLLAEGGRIILSGLLDTQEGEMVEALKDEGLTVEKIVRNGEWLMIEVGA